MPITSQLNLTRANKLSLGNDLLISQNHAPRGKFYVERFVSAQD